MAYGLGCIPILRSALDVGFASHDGALQTFPQSSGIPGAWHGAGVLAGASVTGEETQTYATNATRNVFCIHHHGQFKNKRALV